MTYNVFGGTVNLALSIFVTDVFVGNVELCVTGREHISQTGQL